MLIGSLLWLVLSSVVGANAKEYRVGGLAIKGKSH
jgi:hypothetical protein